MRFQTQWFRRVVGVFTLTTVLFSIPVTKSFAQASLIDPTFKASPGTSGALYSSSGVYSILVQDDGKIIVGGQFTQIGGQACTNLARLNSDGQLDTSFPQGTDGAVYRLLKQPDGKILTAGAFTNLQGVARRGVGRLLTNGMVDLDFDAGNVIGSLDVGFSLGLQSDGKILVGTPVSPSYTNGALFRLNTNGQLDSGFVQTNLFNRWHIFAICPRTNGSILLAGGFLGVNGISSPGLALLHTNGEVDLGFSSPLVDISGVYTLLEQPDHGFLIGGRFWKQGSTNRQALARLTTTLDWDASFQPDPFDPNWEYVSPFGVVMTAIRHSNGKFILGGLFQNVGGYARNHVVRVDSQGHVDPCFDSGFGLASQNLGVLTLAEQANGKILAGGDFSCFSGGPIATLSSSNLVRLLPQTDCGVTRVHLGRFAGAYFVAGTCAPGGTNHLQQSTNLIDWVTIGFDPNCCANPNTLTTRPYLFWELPTDIANGVSGLFFRVKKEY